MRTLLLSTSSYLAGRLETITRKAGLDTLAVVSLRGDPKDLDPGRDEMIGEIAVLPSPHLDVCFAADSRSLARIMRAYEPDLAIVAGWSKLIPADAIVVPKLGVINCHVSVLPRHRGPYAIAWAIRDGDDLGMTIHYMNPAFDEGNILAQDARPMPQDTSPTVVRGIIDEIWDRLLPEAIEAVRRGEPGTPQPTLDIPWEGVFGDDYRHIDWSMPAVGIDRQVRAWQWILYQAGPTGPVATIDGKPVVVTGTSLVEPSSDMDARRFATGDGDIWITEWAPAPEATR